MTTPILPEPCHDCKYFWGVGDSDGPDGPRFVCRAFNDIPFDIVVGKNMHRTPFLGDNGYQYKKMK